MEKLKITTGALPRGEVKKVRDDNGDHSTDSLGLLSLLTLPI